MNSYNSSIFLKFLSENPFPFKFLKNLNKINSQVSKMIIGLSYAWLGYKHVYPVRWEMHYA